MKFVTDYSKLLTALPDAFDLALDDTVKEAQQIASRNSRTGKFADSIRWEHVSGPGGMLTAVIGSPLVSAAVKERGGYITPKSADRLMIPQDDGSYRSPEAVRISAQPAVTPAGERFVDFMTQRLKAETSG